MVMVRTARETDLVGIATVHTAAWQVAYRGIVPDQVLDGLDVERRLEGLRSFMEENLDFQVLVAEQAGDVVGFVGVGPAQDPEAGTNTGEVYAIYVDPDRWGQGIGRALLHAGHDALSTAGFCDAVLWVLQENSRSRRFYEQAGWFNDGQAKREDRGAFVLNEVRYRRELPAS